MTQTRKAVVDTCVIVDMLLASRPRHRAARELRRELIRTNVIARVPLFAIFELNHAIRQEQRLSLGRLVSTDEGGAEGVPIEFVPVDDDFVKKYFDVNLPEMRGGDLVFAALAKGESLPLVTEDGPFAERARSGGLAVYTTVEFTSHLSRIAL